MQVEGGGDNRGEGDDRSYPPVGINSAEEERVKLHGVSEGEESLCVYNSETTPPNNLESMAEEQTRCLRTQMVM
jgi:hypothetical protein